MLPLTLLASQKLASLLIDEDSLTKQIHAIASACNTFVPVVMPSQVVLSAASPEMGDSDLQLLYPRICIYSGGIKNTQTEKFRAISGTVALTAEVWASGNKVSDVDGWIHFYVEAITSILQANIGDWGDNVFYPGTFDVQFAQPKIGGLGYVASAKVMCSLHISRN